MTGTRLALTLLDSRSWLEVWTGSEPGLFRAEYHQPVRTPSVGWVDKPLLAEADDPEAAVRYVLASIECDVAGAVARVVRECAPPCMNCDHGTDPKTLTTCNECEGTGVPYGCCDLCGKASYRPPGSTCGAQLAGGVCPGAIR